MIKFQHVLILVGIVVVLGLALQYQKGHQGPVGVVCTEETKLCPDGSYVGRVSPSCEFAACPSTGGGTVTGVLSHIQGKVLIAPTCPVEKNPPDPNCMAKGLHTTVEARVPGSDVVAARVESGADGTFSFSLPPGTYELSALGGKGVPPTCSNRVVELTTEEVSEVLISCDSGVR